MSDDLSALERVHSSPGILILFAHSNALSAHDRAAEAGEHPNALYHLKHAIDSLERAHRLLVDPRGTAILKDGDAEPVDTWADQLSHWQARCPDCRRVLDWSAKGVVRPTVCPHCEATL